MSFTIALAQCKRPHDDNVIASVENWVHKAAQAGAQLVVFPEALMTAFQGDVQRFVQQAQPADGPFAQAIDAIAAREDLWVCYTINEQNPNGGLPFNTVVITDNTGVQQARYRKVHLFDAQGYSESQRMAAGDALMQPLQTPFACIGAAICYDLRFPEVATQAALAGAQLMLYPAAWVSGPGKVRQWETLLAARAIENGMFVAGVCCVDENRIGYSCVFGPDGTQLVGSDATEQLVTCHIDLAEIQRVRTATPSLQHRRAQLYR